MTASDEWLASDINSPLLVLHYKPTTVGTSTIIISSSVVTSSLDISVDDIATQIYVEFSSLNNPFDPDLDEDRYGIFNLNDYMLFPLCGPDTETILSQSVYISSTLDYNKRYKYIYLSYSSYTTSLNNVYNTYTIIPFKFGITKLLSTAINNNSYSLRLPFACTDLAYKTSYSISLIDTADASLLDGIFTIQNPSNSSYRFIISWNDFNYYSIININVVDYRENSIVIEDITEKIYGLGNLITIPIFYADDVYGYEDNSHSFDIDVDKDHLFLVKEIENKIFVVWAPQRSEIIDVVIRISNIGGHFDTINTKLNASNPPVITDFPDLLECWTEKQLNYEIFINDPNNDDLTVIISNGLIYSYNNDTINLQVSNDNEQTLEGLLTLSVIHI